MMQRAGMLGVLIRASVGTATPRQPFERSGRVSVRLSCRADLTERPPHGPENLVEVGKDRHLRGEPRLPQPAVAQFLLSEDFLKAFEFLTPSRHFAGNGLNNRGERDVPVFGQVPEVVEVTRFVPGTVEQGHHCLGRNLSEGVHSDPGVLGEILIFRIAPEYVFA